jgi:hydroxylamine dehydrogenase
MKRNAKRWLVPIVVSFVAATSAMGVVFHADAAYQDPPRRNDTDADKFDPVSGGVKGKTAPPAKPTLGNYHKDYLPFKDGKYPAPLFTNDTWYFKPIDFQAYVNPEDYYDMLNNKEVLSKEHAKSNRTECLTCHGNVETVAHGSYQQWLSSKHAQASVELLDKYVADSKLLADGKVDEFFKSAGIPKWFVSRVPGIKDVAGLYRTAVIDKLGVDLDSLTGEKSPLYDRGTETYKISCIDCHSKPGAAKTPDQGIGIVLPTTRTCAVCHAKQWAELLSELTVNNPPYAPGRPSHAAGWVSNLAAPWYASNSRYLQMGCDSCHNTEVRGCDSCHTRHNFDPAMARSPKACETCHMGPDHPDYESWSSSKHGHVFETRHPDLKKRIVECVPGKDYTAPSCQYCHMKYQEGELSYVSHNMVAKGIYRMGVVFQDPTGKYIEDKLQPYSPRVALEKAKELGETKLGYQDRRDLWIGVCNDCHSSRFSSAYLDVIDGTMQETYAQLIQMQQQVQSAWDEDLIIGKRWGVRGKDTVQDYLGVHFLLEPPGGLWRWFDRDKYTSSEMERRYAENWFRWTLHTYKGTAHGSPDIAFHLGAAQFWKEQQYVDEEELKLRLLKRLEEKAGISPGELKTFHDRETPAEPRPRPAKGTPTRPREPAKK